MKFLERSELAAYSFQSDFLKPFVVVMRQSRAPAIRELIIRCLSLMVLSRVHSIKSGWKSMFMARSRAAGGLGRTVWRAGARLKRAVEALKKGWRVRGPPRGRGAW